MNNVKCVTNSILDGKQPIFYYKYGDEKKDLIVLIHPAFGDYNCFYHQIEMFAEDHCVICVDLIGHGQSKNENATVKIDKSAFHIAEIMRKEQFDSAHLVGVSLGGLIVQHFALDYPRQVKSITVLGAYDINIKEPYSNNSLALTVKMLFSMDSFRKHLAKLSIISERERERFVQSAKHFKRKSFMVMTTLNEIVKYRADFVRDYPLLILCGDVDNSLALEVAQSLKDTHKGSEYVIIENAGHCANMDNPSKFNEIVLDFIDKH